MKKIYFTSDWHIGSNNIIKLSDRPFKDLEHMHRVLINNYNSTVSKDAICYFLGDIGSHKPGVIEDVIKKLNGFKVCIIGNHDKNSNSLYNQGFDLVLYGAVLYIANKRVTLSHCPLKGIKREDITDMKGAIPANKWHGDHKKLHQKMTFKDERQFHLHGHIHSPNGGRSETILDKQRDVGVDGNNYTPISIKTIANWISTYK